MYIYIYKARETCNAAVSRENESNLWDLENTAGYSYTHSHVHTISYILYTTHTHNWNNIWIWQHSFKDDGTSSRRRRRLLLGVRCTCVRFSHWFLTFSAVPVNGAHRCIVIACGICTRAGLWTVVKRSTEMTGPARTHVRHTAAAAALGTDDNDVDRRPADTTHARRQELTFLLHFFGDPSARPRTSSRRPFCLFRHRGHTCTYAPLAASVPYVDFRVRPCSYNEPSNSCVCVYMYFVQQ